MNKEILNEINRIKSIMNINLINENTVSKLIIKLLKGGIKADIDKYLLNIVDNFSNSGELDNFLKNTTNIDNFKNKIVELIKKNKYSLNNVDLLSIGALTDDELKQLLGGTDLKSYTNSLIKDRKKSISKLLSGGIEADLKSIINSSFKKIKNNEELENFLKNTTNIENIKSEILKKIKDKGYSLTYEEIATISSLSDDELKQLLGNDLKSYVKTIRPDLKPNVKDYIRNIYSNGKGKLTGTNIKDLLKLGLFKKDVNGKYTVSKLKVTAWATALGYSFLKLSGWFEDNGITVTNNETKPTPDETPVNPSKYTEKSDFPFKKWDKSNKIADVQDCLGLTADGKFGNTTEEILKSLGVGDTITKELYDEIMKTCKERRESKNNIRPGTSEPETSEPVKGVDYSRTYGDEF